MKKLLIFICLIVIPQISFVKTDLLIEAINNEFRSDNNKKGTDIETHLKH